jgi:O-antigen ligase
VCLVAAHSGAGYVVAITLPIMLLSLSSVERLAPRFRLMAAAFAFFLMIFFGVFWDEIFKTLLWILGKDPDLTGRTVYWNYLLSGISAELPLYGYGFFAGFALSVAPMIGGATGTEFNSFGNAHNGYLEALVAFGYIGVIIMCCILLSLAWRSVRLVVFGSGSFARINGLPLSIISLLIGYNMVESVILSPNSIWVILLGWCAANLPSSYGGKITSDTHSAVAPRSSIGRRIAQAADSG